MSPSGQQIWDALGRALRRVRGDGVLATALAVAAVVPGVMLVAWAWGPARWSVRGAGPLTLVLVGLGAAVVLAVALARRWVRSVDESAVAAAAERRRDLPEGALRGVLELGRGLPPGVSDALFRRSESEVAARLAGATPAELAGDLGERARRRRGQVLAGALALVLITVVAGFAAPERARGAWAPLLSPVSHLNGPSLPPVTVSPGDAEVPRGDWLDVAVAAPYRTGVTVRWRATGDVPRQRDLAVREGAAGLRIGPVESPIRYWVEAPDGFRTDTFRITPVDPLLLSGLVVDVTYPPYTGREADHFEGDAPPLRLPAGSTLRIRGSATRPLEAAILRRTEGGEERAAAVAGSSFDMEWRPEAESSGTWEWRLLESGAREAVTGQGALDITVVPDAPPEVTITVPGADTLMPPSLRMQVVADAADDYGVAAAQLVLWKVSAVGARGEPTRAPIRTDGADRVLLRTVLDASGYSLIPGDEVHYRVEVRDNSPAGQGAASATYVLRLPSMAEMRDRARETSRDALDRAERLAEATRELATETRDASRKATGSQGERGSTGRQSSRSELGFEEASEAREVLEQHEAMLAEMEEMRRRMAELKESVREAGLEDPELQRQLNELRELYRELATPELQEDIEQLRQSVEELDPEAVREAMERLAEQQEQLREQIEQSLEMMRRAAAQQEMSAVAREAEEVAAQQQALAEAMKEELGCLTPEAAGGCEAERDVTPPTDTVRPMRPPEAPDRAAQQDELRDRTERLQEQMQSLQQQLMQMGEESAATQAGSAGEKTEQAQQSMQQASEQARQQQGEQASQSGQQAAQQMTQAAQQLDQARDEMQQQAQQAMQQAMQQATQEALSMAQRQESLRQQMEQAQQGGQQPQQQGGQQPQQQSGGQQSGQQDGGMQQMRSEQAALQQGLQQLGRNLSEAGQQSGMMNQEVGQSLARASLNMQRTMEGLEQGERLPVQDAERTVESLNQLAMSLLQNDAQMQQMQGSAQQQAMQQLADLAQQQGSLNGQTGAVAPMDLARQAMQRQLQQMAQQQRGIARRVGSVSDMVGGQDNMLGQLDQLSAEAEAIARELEGGRLDQDVMARQERLFHRLLDAGRTLEREEYSDERVAERPGDLDAAPPAAIDPALLDPSLRYPVPSAAELRSLPPAYRRLILEYFNRLNAGGGAGPGDRGGA